MQAQFLQGFRFWAVTAQPSLFFFIMHVRIGLCIPRLIPWVLKLMIGKSSNDLQAMIKISVNTDISVIGFYGNIGNIGKISVDIFTKISVIKIFYILII